MKEVLMSACVSAVQHIRRLRGGSQSQLLRASDGGHYVCKLSNNPQHIRVLANEMLATRLGHLLGLPMPHVQAIEVSAWLVEHSADLRIDLAGSSIPCKPGRHFGSLYVQDPASGPVLDYLPEELLNHVTNIDDFPRVIVLDKWTCNADGRQAVFTRRRRGNYSATFIDQGYCFNAGEWSFPDSPLRGVYARNHVYRTVTGWDAFEPALTRAEQLSVDDIRRIADAVPPEWYEFDTDGLHRLVEALGRRRSIIRDLITQFRTSTRNPFPLWTSP
jgi:HipA-like protein